jgi:ARC6-like, IMS domain
MGQIQQAYADRNLQQLRHEYTALAIESRRKLLKDAYEVLAHPTERSQYDADQMADNLHFTQGDNPLFDLDVDNDRVLGGLLILSEIGEYEKVLSIAWPLIGSDAALAQITDSAELEETRIALNLTAALALLELGRERWRQNEPSDGCAALETGIKLLRQQGIFPTVQAEIQKELSKFRPQYILSLLAASGNDSTAARQQVLSLLQELVENCSGRQGYMTYGMTQDGFIAYIDQIRRYLTTTEQQSLFEGPAVRLGDPVFTYLLVYAMVARGFHYRMPELIYRANQLLLQNLSRLQDVFIEQALCYLLLGQQAEANNALSRSRDQETLNYIRKNSPAATDLIQGLCRYSELWFQSQVYPHFLDLSPQQASLGQYFEDRQVQVYLDDLPQPEPLIPEVMLIQPVFSPRPETSTLPNYRGSVPLISSIGRTESIQASAVPQDLPPAERVGYPEPVPQDVPGNVVPFERPPKKRESLPTNVVELDGTNHRPALSQLNNTDGGKLAAVPDKELTRRPRILAITRRHHYDLRFLFRLMTVSFASLIGVFTVVLMVNTTAKWFKQHPVAKTNNARSLPLPVVTAGSTAPVRPAPATTVGSSTAALLTPNTAQALVENWLKAKTNSLARQHDLQPLDRVLVEPALARAQQRAQEARADGSYWRYQHQVNQVQVQAAIPDRLESKTIDALVQESADYFDRYGQRSDSRSYNKKLHIKYELFNKNGQWFIKDMTVVP